MQNLDCLNQVAEFHKTFKHPILSEPQIPSKERCNLRISLIAEELKELQEAIEDNNIIEVADALADIQYVLAGAILEFGLGEKFRDIFDEVQRSNMSKACHSIAEAEETIAHYAEKGVNAYFKEIDGKYLVYRENDHKTLKNVYYSPADIKKIIHS